MPLARLYPRMTLTLRAPVELENLLPYDIKFRIHDKNTGLSSSNFLVKGGSSPIHTVELSHLLLLSVAPEDTSELEGNVSVKADQRSRPQAKRLRHYQHGRSRATNRKPLPSGR